MRCWAVFLWSLCVNLVASWSSLVRPHPSRLPSVRLGMGLLDSFSGFLKSREGDFVKLEDSGSAYGPGPALILYKVPAGILTQEVHDMIADGAPKASTKGVKVARIFGDEDALLDLSVEEALLQVVRGSDVSNKDETEMTPQMDIVKACPVLLFSGVSNSEMMDTYNIIGKEVYDESGGTLSPACAKAVPNAMQKPLRQVFEEISGDHIDAIAADSDSTADPA